MHETSVDAEATALGDTVCAEADGTNATAPKTVSKPTAARLEHIDRNLDIVTSKGVCISRLAPCIVKASIAVHHVLGSLPGHQPFSVC